MDFQPRFQPRSDAFGQPLPHNPELDDLIDFVDQSSSTQVPVGLSLFFSVSSLTM